MAKTLSIIFHPLLMTTYIFIGMLFGLPLLLNFSPSMGLRFISMVFVTTFLIPFIGILFLKYTRTITKLEMDDRKERFFPFLFITLFYTLTAYLFYDKFRFPPIIINVLIGVSFSLALLTVITLFWKISAHAIAVAGTVGIFVALLIIQQTNELLWVLSISMLMMGAVGSARLKLCAHTSQQVWYGYLLGFIINFITILILN